MWYSPQTFVKKAQTKFQLFNWRVKTVTEKQTAGIFSFFFIASVVNMSIRYSRRED